MAGCPTSEQLSAFHDGELDEVRRAEIEERFAPLRLVRGGDGAVAGDVAGGGGVGGEAVADRLAPAASPGGPGDGGGAFTIGSGAECDRRMCADCGIGVPDDEDAPAADG